MIPSPCEGLTFEGSLFSMTNQPSRNPRALDEARALSLGSRRCSCPWNVPALVASFTEDCVVRFGDIPEFRGRAALEKLLQGHSRRQKDYSLRKELRALMGDTLANYWEAEWGDQDTGAKMAGRVWKSGSCAMAGSPCGRLLSTPTRSASPVAWGCCKILGS